ncbi:MAG: murein biosynthesis integral membrane protein MurJ [Peptococcaceae bacterium]|nr:murein biosynthesis integral membrane protein MurJ [Peptococcaceae bacterium]
MSTFSGVVAQATVVLILLNITSKLTAVVREALFASHFSVSAVADAYTFAATFPTVLFYLFAGALTTVVVPIYSEYAAAGREREAWGLFGTLFVILLAILLFVTTLGIVAAPWIVRVFSLDFSVQTIDIAIHLTQLMFPFLIFSGLAALFSGLLHARGVFAVTALNGPLGNIAVILAILLFSSQWGIAGVAVGMLVGALAGAVVQIPHLYRAGFRFFPGVPFNHPDLKRILILILPITISYSISETYIIVDRFLASGLPVGSIASLNYANKLIQMPLGLFVIAVGTAVFPTLSRLATEGDLRSLGETVQRSFRLVILICLPAAVTLLVMRVPIITLFYKRGHFGDEALYMTVIPLFFYSFGLIGQAGEFILVRGFFAMQNTRTPMFLSGFAALVNLVLCLLLVGPMKHGGLALGNALAALLNMTLLFFFLHRRLGNLWTRDLLRFIPSVLLAAVVMAAAMTGLSGWLELDTAATPTILLAVQLAMVVITCCGVFVGVLALLRLDETRLLWAGIKKMIRK